MRLEKFRRYFWEYLYNYIYISISENSYMIKCGQQPAKSGYIQATVIIIVFGQLLESRLYSEIGHGSHTSSFALALLAEI